MTYKQQYCIRHRLEAYVTLCIHSLAAKKDQSSVVCNHFQQQSDKLPTAITLLKRTVVQPVAPVAQRYHVTSDTLGREFDPGKRDFSHLKTKNENKNAQRMEND